ncbi:MAG: 2-C-methyl-D-erythritol 2,4-cyclodiphosphate synthase [Phycisphaerae bacterium]|jgi:2-C-methyl-D-erythritol 2,4-cyclodiphosphate synthase|nr:2-C-methyl-D-erythritol 2,4-cyclodiphosphate synthase [Phycisphaerae bacterium]MDP7636401.1 2-C-methyl-D-erythritol 2,4-cyclodiphosphate synthase [Phycisphaerae bacterium]
MMYRIGLGYDSHPFVHERTLKLGGLEIPFALGLGGHSDADVVLHALTDAILGAVGQGDIGEQFPDSDPAYHNADSGQFVRQAVAMAAQRGYRVANCDVTVLAEKPSLREHKPPIRAKIAELLGVKPDAVSIKAKTNEGMGFVGRSEGIAAIAVVMVAVDTTGGNEDGHQVI